MNQKMIGEYIAEKKKSKEFNSDDAWRKTGS